MRSEDATKGIALLGSTGSIGQSALSVIERHRERFRVVSLSANRNAHELHRQIEAYAPELAVLVDARALNGLEPRAGVRVRTGRDALLEAAAHPEAEIVLNAVVGSAGLEATLVALAEGKRLALANKESLVTGGPLVLEARRAGGGELIPVDSEHSAILQCLHGAGPADVKRIILTASGGPFRTYSAESLAEVTPSQALCHPTWAMGAKITVDSATLVNKALEVIEAHFLFGIPYDRIDVVIHPQSIIHSMIEFVDGSVLAQLGFPTMELPILYALSYPERFDDAGTTFDPLRTGQLTFEPVDDERFPAFRLGAAAGRAGGTAPAVFNAVNEIAVASFLAEELPFHRIAEVIERTLCQYEPTPADSLEAVLEADREARATARTLIREIC